MAKLELQNVSVEIPVFDAKTRSFSNRILGGIKSGRNVGGSFSNEQGRLSIKALQNVSFSATSGDRYGLLGHNGAGKTTLLKVASGIYPPTSGKVITEGKVSAIFDHSTGISPDETGWENIEIRGILLGLNDRQIEALKTEVHEKSGLDKYLDLPVRTYSAGMKTRLSFFISTSLSPDLLIMDESILAGDANFIKVAQARVEELIAHASIILLASHSVNVLRKFCNKGVLMHEGSLKQYDDIDQMISDYNAK